VGEAEQFGDRYEVLRSLGEGGMGVVYEVFDRQRDVRVALKTAQHLDANALYRFKSEFRTLADVSHPGLVSLYDLVTEGPRPFFTMELVEGKSFLEWTRGEVGSACADTMPCAVSLDAAPRSAAKGPLADAPAAPRCDMVRLRSAARQLAETIIVLHGAGKLHRDLKPSNVLVTAEGRVVVLDFGLAVDLGRQRASRPSGVVGTAEYMSPEHAASKDLTEESDWYSFGVMLYEALTGRLPLEGPLLQLLVDKQHVDPPAPASIADVPEDLDSLCRDLLQRDPKKRPSGLEVLRRLTGPRDLASGPSLVARGVDAPFVGREAQMQQLRDAFRLTSAGSKALVLHVRGISGMGKSALLARFTEELAQGTDTVVLAGRCYERETVPFKAVDSLVDAITRFLCRLPHSDVEALLPRGILTLSRVFPVLSRVRSIATYPRRAFAMPDPQELRRSAFGAFRELIQRIAVRSKVVLLLDDLQWGDSDSGALLLELLRMPDAPPVLIVLSYRTEEAEASPLLAALRSGLREVQQVHVEVSPLGLADAEDLAEKLLADGAPPDSAPERTQPVEADAAKRSARVTRIAQESQGSPYFVDELVRFSRAGGGLDGVTLRLDDALHQRISGLSDDAVELLRTVAVAGGIVSEEVAVRAARLAADAAHKAPALLRAEHLLRGMRRGTALDTFHDRVRETVIAHLGPDVLQSIHARLAAAFLASGSTDAEVLTFHFGAAGDTEREAEWAMVAAKKAEGALAFGRAVVLYERILALGLADQPRLAILGWLGDALTNAGRWGEAATLRLDLAAEVDPVQALQLKTVAGEQLLCSGRFDRGAALLAEVLRAVHVHVPRSPLATLLGLVCARIFLNLRGLSYRLREGELPQALTVRIDPLLAAGYGFSMTESALGSYFNTRALIRALHAGDAERLLRALTAETCFSATEGCKAERRTLRRLARLRTLADTVGTPFSKAMVGAGSAFYHYFVRQDYPTSKSLFTGTERMLAELCVGQFWTRATARTLACHAMMKLGQKAELVELVTTASREMDVIGDLYGLINLRTGPLAWIRLADDEPELSREELDEVEAQLPRSRFIWQTYIHQLASAQLCLYTGRGEDAFQKMEQTWGPLRWSLLLRISTLRIEAWELRGRASLAAASEATSRERERRLRLAETAAGRLVGERSACSDGLSALLRAGVQSLRHRAKEAIELARQAERAFEAASMGLHVAASRWFLGACLGGADGGALADRAREAMASAGIRRPDRFAAMLAPGSLAEAREAATRHAVTPSDQVVAPGHLVDADAEGGGAPQ
jgi:tRNA A-37 threonylcarbamoyl transferase component Bud32